MKKLIAIIFMLALSIMTVNASESKTAPKDFRQPPSRQEMEARRAQREAAFEQKLGLTEDQKVQARQLRKQGFEKMKPVIEQIKAKKQEALTIKNSNASAENKQKELTQIDKEIKALQKQAHEIRQNNMKEFESILTADQKKTLKEMKKEGRENFKKNHPHGKGPVTPLLPQPPRKLSDK